MTDKLVVLIDGDIFAYKAACVNQEDIDLGDGIVSAQTNPQQAASDVESLIDNIVVNLSDASPKSAVDVHVCLTGPLQEISGRNFRKEVYADYKNNRDPKAKPVLLPFVKEHMRKVYSTKIKDGIEADDVIGILMTHPTLMPGKKVCVTIDKDLLQIPGRHFNPDKDLKRMVSEQQGDYWFMYQTLVGDQVDNYPGCKGVGPVNAEKILKGKTTLAEMWPAVVDAFLKKKFSIDDALVQARCARMLRHYDYDFKRKEAILWTPNF